MATKRILVTGANGYVGTHVVQAVLDCGYEAVACDVRLDRVPAGAARLNVNIFEAGQNLYEMAGKPDVLIHLAWRNGFRHNADTHMQDLPLHIRFLQDMIDAGIQTVSVMGSMHEVGYWEGAITADSPTNPQSMYAIAKNALRQAAELMVAGKNTQLCWLRGYYLFGDDERNSSVLGKILIADRNGQEWFPFTSGENLYDFLPVQELARQIVAASVQKKYSGIINCCSGEPISLGEMAQKFIAEHGLKIKLQYGAFPDRPYDSPGVWGDATVIREILKEQKG